MRIMAVVSLCFVALSASGCTDKRDSGQTLQQTSSLRDYVQAYVANGDFSGIIATSNANGEVGIERFGYADFETGTPFAENSSFHIASISKTFTAAAVLRLQEQGVLALDDTLDTYLPAFPNARSISIEHLLNHSSGIVDYWALPDADQRAKTPMPTGDLLAWIGGFPLQFEPGSENRYSNSGYAVLAAVIEQVSGQAYHDFVDQMLSERLGANDISAFQNDATANGYQPAHSGHGVARYEPYDPSILVGAGSLKSNAKDLLKWCRLFISDFNDPDTPSLTYGWGARSSGGARWAQQTGRTPGYASHIRAYPDSGDCIVVLSNIESEAVAEIGGGVAEIVAGNSAEVPALRPQIPLQQDKARDYVGVYEIAPGNRLEVRAEGAFLSLKGQNGVFLPLEPVGEDQFFFRQLNVFINAERDETGLVGALLWGGSYPIPRVEEG